MPQKLTYQLALIVLLGIIVLFIRNPDPVLNPALFGEDGPWLNGFLLGDLAMAYLNNRPDYLTVGQSAMLNIAVFLNSAFFGDNIAHLPQVIAGMSYLFWAGVAATGFAALQPWVRLEWRAVVAIGIILMPMGTHSNEIIGRVLNLGYMFFPLAVFLIALRPQVRFDGWKYLIDVLLLVCCATNPLCIALVGGYAALSTFLTFRKRAPFPLRDLVVGGLIAAICLFYLTRFGSAPPVNMGEPNADRLVEAVIARSLLYPFIFPAYSGLGDAWAIAFAIPLAALLGWSVYRSDGAARVAGSGLLAALAIVVIGTIASRYSLTAQLQGYTTTFPDRYYYAQNVMIVVCVAWAMSQITVRATAPLLLGLCFIYALGSPLLFEFSAPKMPIAVAGTLQESAATALPPDSYPTQSVNIPTYPAGWSVQAPARVVEATALGVDRAPSLEPLPKGYSFILAFSMIFPLLLVLLCPFMLAAGVRRSPQSP